ncbi:hypothetical protein E0G79_21785 [Salmonella enterica]|nr:hypothetical protein [Salmonella enterica]EBA9765169.1 hypothetical protein [Salmonella enterica]EEB5698903.1 hypothetical protein [Salmonella enterica]EGX5147326.1 hypothetical protein [Salmonella enterica]EHQ9355009.1 hypothetical protein [Salmonella enterica]
MIHSLTRSVLVMTICFLTGCGTGLTGLSGQAKNKKSVVTTGIQQKTTGAVSGSTVQPDARSTPSAIRSDSAVDKCGRELKALKRLDARRYALRKTQFDRLMSGASVYADVRTDVAGGTRDAVDAMYRFRTGKLCSEISQDVLDALARQEGGRG